MITDITGIPVYLLNSSKFKNNRNTVCNAFIYNIHVSNAIYACKATIP